MLVDSGAERDVTRLANAEAFAHKQFMQRHTIFMESRDAAYECTHGRLPGDRTPPCGCFHTEPRPTPDLMRTLAQAEKEIHVSIDTERIASQVRGYMAECPNKVPATDVAASLVQPQAAVSAALKALTIKGDLMAEGQTRNRRYWNPNSLIETPVEPDPEPASASGPAHDEIVAEDHEAMISGAAAVLAHKLATLDAGRDAIRMQIATLEAELAQSNDARARLVQAVSAIENLDMPVAA
jgi:hypothetical protein